MNKLRAENISVQFKGRKVVNNVSLTVETSEIVGLLGPNGAGKTTCFYMIVGLIPCREGAIYLDTQNITNMAMHHRAKIGVGYLPQEMSIFRGLSVEQNITAILETRDIDKRQRKQICDALLDDFQLDHLRDARGSTLSGGERRRVEIARALALEPKFILLDEPFAGVDPISVSEIQRVLNNIKQKNIGLLITDHNVRETLGICDRAYILNNGQVIASGEPNKLLKDDQVRTVYLGKSFSM